MFESELFSLLYFASLESYLTQNSELRQSSRTMAASQVSHVLRGASNNLHVLVQGAVIMECHCVLRSVVQSFVHLFGRVGERGHNLKEGWIRMSKQRPGFSRLVRHQSSKIVETY